MNTYTVQLLRDLYGYSMPGQPYVAPIGEVVGRDSRRLNAALELEDMGLIRVHQYTNHFMVERLTNPYPQA